MSLRATVTRSVVKGLFWWSLAGIALGTRELHMFYPNLLGV